MDAVCPGRAKWGFGKPQPPAEGAPGLLSAWRWIGALSALEGAGHRLQSGLLALTAAPKRGDPGGGGARALGAPRSGARAGGRAGRGALSPDRGEYSRPRPRGLPPGGASGGSAGRAGRAGWAVCVEKRAGSRGSAPAHPKGAPMSASFASQPRGFTLGSSVRMGLELLSRVVRGSGGAGVGVGVTQGGPGLT